jgi:hypothetical protein
MAAALRSLSRTTYTSRTNTTITAPSGIVNGDILTLGFITGRAVAGDPGPTFPAGFSLKSGHPQFVTLSTFWVYIWVAEKTASSESGDYTVTHSAMSSQGVIFCASGAEASQVTYNSGTGTTSTATGLTTGTDDALVAFVAQNWQLYGTASPPTGTTPTFTEQLDAADSLIYAATGVLATAGATGDKSHANLNTAGDPWQALLIGWDAADAGPPPPAQRVITPAASVSMSF